MMHVRKGRDSVDLTMNIAGKKFYAWGYNANQAIIKLSRKMIDDLVFRYLDVPEVIFEWVNCHKSRLRGKLNKAVNEGFDVEVDLYKHYPDGLKLIKYSPDKWGDVIRNLKDGYRIHRIVIERSDADDKISLVAYDYTKTSNEPDAKQILAITLKEADKFYFYTCWVPLREAAIELKDTLQKRLVLHFIDNMKVGQQC